MRIRTINIHDFDSVNEIHKTLNENKPEFPYYTPTPWQNPIPPYSRSKPYPIPSKTSGQDPSHTQWEIKLTPHPQLKKMK